MADTTETLEERFERLADQWADETGHLSNLKTICAHPACRELIAMGWPAVPLILHDFEEGNFLHWFPVLTKITGTMPVKENHRGVVRLMAEDWLEWGREHGHI